MMNYFIRVLFVIATIFGLTETVAAQSGCPYIAQGAVLTAAQWNQCFANKQDALGFTPINPANLIGSPPITITPSGGIVTIGLDTDSSLTVTGSNLGINPANTNAFTLWQIIDRGSGSSQPAIGTGAGWELYGSNGSPVRDEITAFNNSTSGATAIFDGRTANGTRLAPTAVTTGLLLSSFEGKGYDTSVWTGTGASFHSYAQGTWTTISHPGAGCIAATPAGSTTTVDDICVFNDGGIVVAPSALAASSQGPGTINVSGNYYIHGAPVTPTTGGANGQVLQGVTSAAPIWTGAATLSTSLAIGGATIGSNALAVNGLVDLNLGTLGGTGLGFQVLATAPVTLTGTYQSVLFDTTPQGSSNQTLRAMRISLDPGYTGPGFTTALSGGNSTLGTGNTVIPPVETVNYIANVGLTGGGTATLTPGAAATTGAEIGVGGHATGGLINVGVLGLAQVSVNSGQNFGGVFSAYNAGTGSVSAVGVFASLNAALPAAGISAALIADNGAQASPIALFRANGVTKVTIDQSGNMNLGGLTVTSSFTATGLVTNADLVSASITVGGATCTLGGSCSPGAGAIAVGDSLTGGTPNGLLYNSANTIGNLATANSGVLVTSSGGVPSISSTLPSGIAATNMALTTPTLGVAAGTSLALGGATIGSNVLAVNGSANFAAGTIADGAQGFTISGTMSTTLTAGLEQSILFSVTSPTTAASVASSLEAVRFTFASGYTGSGTNKTLSAGNGVLGTGTTVIPAAESINFNGNVAVAGGANATLTPGAPATTGAEMGTIGHATGGTINVGALGLAQVSSNSGTNIGVAGSGYNAGTGTAPEIGGFFSLNQTVLPTVSAALIADNGSNTNCSSATCPIFLGRANAVTKVAINNDGTVSLTSGTLAAGAQALNITATQPASPSVSQSAIAATITGNGSTAQSNFAFSLT